MGGFSSLVHPSSGWQLDVYKMGSFNRACARGLEFCRLKVTRSAFLICLEIWGTCLVLWGLLGLSFSFFCQVYQAMPSLLSYPKAPSGPGCWG